MVFGGRGLALVPGLGLSQQWVSVSHVYEDGVQVDRGSVMVLPSISDRVKYYQAVLNKWSSVKALSG